MQFRPLYKHFTFWGTTYDLEWPAIEDALASSYVKCHLQPAEDAGKLYGSNAILNHIFQPGKSADRQGIPLAFGVHDANEIRAVCDQKSRSTHDEEHACRQDFESLDVG